MVAACTKLLVLYNGHQSGAMVDDTRASKLWCLINEHFDSFQQVYDERYQGKYGFWRPVIEHSVAAFLKCGDLQEGFARVRCADCKQRPCKHGARFVAFSCKQRCACPSCHQKRTLMTGIHRRAPKLVLVGSALVPAEDVCFPVAHRQVVFTIPKRLRVYARFDRKLL